MNFIDVKKISPKTATQKNGDKIINPATGSPIIEDYHIHNETIRVDEIKAFRKWDKDDTQIRFIDGDVTVIYFKGDKSNRGGVPQMLIQESWENLSKRIKSIPTD